MKLTRWIPEEELEAAVQEFVKKYDEKNLKDDEGPMFFKALFGGILGSKKEEEDEDKQELWEAVSEDIDAFQSLGYCIEVRGLNQNFLFELKPDIQRIGEYEGEFNIDEANAILGTKHVTWMDWTPACMLKIMKGDPNTDPEFFSGDCKVVGTIKLGAKPRGWIYDLFTFIEREIE
jgi:hypothetical protein